MHPILGTLIVNFVLCLICFIAYSSQIFIIWPWYGREMSVELLVLLVPFKCVVKSSFAAHRSLHFDLSLFVGMLLWNYYLCVNTDPGRVPENWVRGRYGA
jgi:palmitoyltransferase ZDHHC6